ncbi:hypothetical protein OESDEN_07726 [Oesophagostomum dentatum]|uniref:Uncharacterized protein n=1 Tax=Oesophagostomum dentatum TaxID=61180 RepID=A0A0B1T559_OESDE|nr:hypothetical protein OESDEN_07726 [Oesophagostomum dentatum]
MLQIEEGDVCMQFSCPSCPYVCPVTKKVSSRIYPKLKDLEEVLGGPSVWDNAQFCISQVGLIPNYRRIRVSGAPKDLYATRLVNFGDNSPVYEGVARNLGYKPKNGGFQ